uniref:CFA20 domain-containing protein n=1 Tax=Globisporangium ultimum (strain ATCC 200006 / CBS 805.95 / DAOM BR144) TaxID=431595 RepID=K3W6T8_GLOUD
MSSLSTSLSSSSFVQIGDGSYSPGDVFLECLLPKVIQKNRSHAMISPSASNKQLHHQYNRQHQHLKNVSPHSSSHSPGASEGDDGDANGVHVLPFADHPVIQQAQDECRNLLNGNIVSILEDEDVKEEIVEVLGPESELVFSTRNIFRYLVLFVKNLGQYFEFQVEVVDDKQKYRYLKATNARSLARVDNSVAQLPLAFGQQQGWRYLCMDLQELTMQAFGTKHVTTTQVRIGGNCRLLRVFFQDELYSDAELPTHLTFLG